MKSKSKVWHYWGIVLVVLGLAFALRLWGLTATSLWYDETFMLFHAQQGVLPAIRGLFREDNALPLHGALLALWVQFAGSGEFAARYLSVLLGTLSAPLVLRLGGAFSGRRYGGWGAALAYASLPIFVYYTQEVRMYALAVPLAAGFAWTAWRLLSHGHGGRVYVVLGVLLVMAHLYAGLLWAALLLWGAMLWLLSRLGHASLFPYPRRFWRANFYLGLALIPVGVWALWRASIDATAVSAVSAAALRWIPVQFGVGQYLAEPWLSLFAAVTLLALVLTLVQLWRERRVQSVLWLLAVLWVPLLLLLSATLVKAKWSERYLLPSFGLALVVGCGSAWELLLRGRDRADAVSRWRVSLPKLVGGGLLVVWLGLALPAVARQASGVWAVGLTDEWHPRPDFRGVARYIETQAEAGDVVLVVGGYAAHTLDYYYDGEVRIFGLPYDVRLLDTGQALDLHALEILEREVGSAQRLWLVLWQDHLADPSGLLQSHLVDTCRRLDVTQSFTNVGVLLFDLQACRPLDSLVTPPYPLDEPFTVPVSLAGYALTRAEDLWEVDLWWETTGPLPADYTVFVHLVDREGVQVTQHDHIAGADAYPTSRWRAGTLLRDRFFLALPGGECPDCVLWVGLYTAEGRVLLRDGRDYVELLSP